jgi:hypothetical protein
MAAFLADVILILHVAFVIFVVGGLILIWVGWKLRWKWVRNLWFRLVHLLAIGVVVAQSWLGIVCPLTTWEMTLRRKTGEKVYEGSFIDHWLGELLYIEAPWQAFLISYTLFGLLVLGSLILIPPRRNPARRRVRN